MSAAKEFVLDDSVEECAPSLVGGKAYNLWLLRTRLSYQQCRVPPFFCITTPAFQHFVQVGIGGCGGCGGCGALGKRVLMIVHRHINVGSCSSIWVTPLGHTV